MTSIIKSNDNILLKDGQGDWNSPTDFKAPTQQNIAGYVSDQLSSLQNTSARIPLTSSLSFTVGSSGDYTSLHDAIYDVYNTYYPSFSGSNDTGVTLNLEPGYSMTGSLYFNSMDLSWISVVGTIDIKPTTELNSFNIELDNEVSNFIFYWSYHTYPGNYINFSTPVCLCFYNCKCFNFSTITSSVFNSIGVSFISSTLTNRSNITVYNSKYSTYCQDSILSLDRYTSDTFDIGLYLVNSSFKSEEGVYSINQNSTLDNWNIKSYNSSIISNYLLHNSSTNETGSGIFSYSSELTGKVDGAISKVVSINSVIKTFYSDYKIFDTISLEYSKFDLGDEFGYICDSYLSKFELFDSELSFLEYPPHIGVFGAPETKLYIKDDYPSIVKSKIYMPRGELVFSGSSDLVFENSHFIGITDLVDRASIKSIGGGGIRFISSEVRFNSIYVESASSAVKLTDRSKVYINDELSFTECTKDLLIVDFDSEINGDSIKISNCTGNNSHCIQASRSSNVRFRQLSIYSTEEYTLADIVLNSEVIFHSSVILENSNKFIRGNSEDTIITVKGNSKLIMPTVVGTGGYVSGSGGGDNTIHISEGSQLYLPHITVYPGTTRAIFCDKASIVNNTHGSSTCNLTPNTITSDGIFIQ